MVTLSACDIKLGCVWWLAWKHEGWLRLGVGVKYPKSSQKLNLGWLKFLHFHGLFRFKGIDYGLVVSPMRDASRRININMFIFAVQEEVEHLHCIPVSKLINLCGYLLEDIKQSVLATLCMSRVEFTFAALTKMTAWGMLTLHDMDAVLGEIGEQLANRRGFRIRCFDWGLISWFTKSRFYAFLRYVASAYRCLHVTVRQLVTRLMILLPLRWPCGVHVWGCTLMSPSKLQVDEPI